MKNGTTYHSVICRFRDNDVALEWAIDEIPDFVIVVPSREMFIGRHEPVFGPVIGEYLRSDALVSIPAIEARHLHEQENPLGPCMNDLGLIEKM